ncbi:MAG: carbamoyltransferase HypF [Bacteroidota bacterium]
MQTYHIHINGIVQGVGFRPMVYQLAKKMDLKGYVKNGSDGVHVFFNAEEKAAHSFFEGIKESAPPLSKIISSGLHKVEESRYTDFSIVVEDDVNYRKQVLISPDITLCGTCKSELHDKNNRRFRYPFITCTQCGPRYSIMQGIPYERQNSSMEHFHMCESCMTEYEDVLDRRFFSQTNSCIDCSVGFSISGQGGANESIESEAVLAQVKSFLEQGKILAVKGIGGYLLLCCADSPEAIQLLRSRKHRPSKPLAVLYPDIETVQTNFNLNGQEKALLESRESPIVLLYPRQLAYSNLAVNAIAPGLRRLGVMLPYSPLLELIATDYGMPLIATSGNISGSPIIYTEEAAHEHLFEIADYIVDYDRHILVPQDDSVVQVSKHAGQRIVLRRSRGYAPAFLGYTPKKKAAVLSMGALLKSSFSLSVNGNVFVSQFLGSGEGYESQQMYKDTLMHWLDMYEVNPAVVITDKHPNYFSHQYGIELAEKYGADLKFVQHHEAHFAAVLAENDLLQSAEAVMGVIWDGTGFGNDGNLWGGEFFKFENNEILRCYHFDYFPAIAGDKQALEPRIAALCATSDGWPKSASLKEKFTDTEWNNYQLLCETTSIFSSSAGRIFDAVASLLDICDKQTYEGEAAMYLQALAEEYVDENGFGMDSSYFIEGSHYYRIPTASLMQGIIRDIEKNKPKNYIAAKFHYSLVCLIDIVAKNVGVEKICFSGGVFQNALLLDWIQHEYSCKYQLYFHKNLSPNDENISFGQMAYFDNNITTTDSKNHQQTEKINHPSQIINQVSCV